jgi:hypothetical protein
VVILAVALDVAGGVSRVGGWGKQLAGREPKLGRVNYLELAKSAGELAGISRVRGWGVGGDGREPKLGRVN